MRGLSGLSCVKSRADCVAHEVQSMYVLYMNRLSSVLHAQKRVCDLQICIGSATTTVFSPNNRDLKIGPCL